MAESQAFRGEDQVPALLTPESFAPSLSVVGAPKRAPKLTSAQIDEMNLFLGHLRGTGNIRSACKRVDRPRSWVIKMRETYKAFDAAMDIAIQDAVDMVEGVGFQLALKGDTKMIAMFLQAHRPHLYRPATRAGADLTQLSDDELRRIAQGGPTS